MEQHSLWIFIGAGMLCLIGFIVIYNKLVNYRQTTYSSESSIKVELKKRYDLIPEVVDTVNSYVEHENRMLTKLTELRTMIKEMTPEIKKEWLKLDKQFFSTFFAVAENYPVLRSSDNYMHLQQVLKETENSIAASRHVYNSNVDYYNSYRDSFPAMIIAGMFGFEKKEYLDFDENIQDRPDLESMLEVKPS